MKDKTLLIKLFVVSIAFTFSACQKSEADSIDVSPSPTISTNQTLNVPVPDSPIRKIDFKNFSFPETDSYTKFTLKNGEKLFEPRKEEGIILEDVEFSDLTGDGKEEAILWMSIQTGGSMIPNLVYIYTLKNGKPKFLWGFLSGDRAAGGLKKVYSEDGKLIVEFFGDTKFIENKNEFKFPSELSEVPRGLCCPIEFTQFYFKWNGKNFAAERSPELIKCDEKFGC